MKVVVSGAAGYLGSHCSAILLKEGIEVIGIDDFSNSNNEQVSVSKKNKKFRFIKLDLKNKLRTHSFFSHIPRIEAVFHFAGFKSVPESVENPHKYWMNNLLSTMNLVEAMISNKCNKLIFSSSATVYGNSDIQPLKESFPLKSLSPYGSTKIAIENYLEEVCSTPELNAISLRYFNPVGSLRNSKLFENPLNKPTNLMPMINLVALGIKDKLMIYGGDYNTNDGTAERDYIHVVDLIYGHLKALDYLQNFNGHDSINLGTGKKTSVLELVNSYSSVNKIDIPYIITDRRSGDVPICYCDSEKAKNKIDWQSKGSIEEMCSDAWESMKNLKL